MNPAIHCHPDGFRQTGAKLMGRHAAGQSFLRAFLSQADNDTFFCQADAPDHAAEFEAAVRAAGGRSQWSAWAARISPGFRKRG